MLAILLCSCSKSQEVQWQKQYDLGVRYLSEGNYEEAIIAFTAAIEIDPKRAEAYLSLADVYLALEDYEEAQAVLERALEQVDETQAVQSKLEEIEELAAQAEPAMEPDGGGQDPQSGADPEPGGETAPAQEPGEAPEESQEATDEEPSESAPAEELEQTAPTQEMPEPESESEPEPQLPETFTSYQYAVDMVGVATLWDAYRMMEQSGVYTSIEWDSMDGYVYYMTYATDDWAQYLDFTWIAPDELMEMEFTSEGLTTEELLGYCSGCVISGVDGRYGSSGIGISPVFSSGMTYEEILQACEANGYTYSVQENPAYSETYLQIELGGGKVLSFTRDELDASGAAPEFFDVYMTAL